MIVGLLDVRKLLGGFGGRTGGTPAILAVPELTADPEGGWSWFADPRAVYYNGNTYWGYLDSSGDVTARSTANATRVTSSAFRLHAALEIDDHDNPSIVVRASDHRLLYFYSKHSGPSMYLRISTNPEDISAFGTETDLDSQLGGVAYTYPNPIQLSGESGAIYLFYRDPIDVNTTAMRYSKSTDGGATWAAQTLLFETVNRSAYWKVSSDGVDRIDFGLSDGHPMYDANVSIFHFYYQGGNVYKSDGTLIGALGSATLHPADITKVYDGTTGDTAWIWDVALVSGVPYIAYATFPSTTDHRYNYARWTGSSWSTHQIVAGGTYIPTAIASSGVQLEVYYSGGVVLDHADPTVVYLSIGTGSDRWNIWRYVTPDGGATWTALQLSASGKQVRPVSVRNYDPRLQALWWSGTYASYTSYHVGTEGAGT